LFGRCASIAAMHDWAGVGAKIADRARARIPPRKFCEKFPEMDMMHDGGSEGLNLMVDKYLEQYERMRRSFDRFRGFKPGIVAHNISSDYEDDIYAFFMHCYHLKDWIKNDRSVKARMPNIASGVEQFINESEALSLCADLCNSLKHLELKRSRSGEGPAFGRKQYHYRLNIGSGSSIRLAWLIERNSKPPIDALELATECIDEWDKFLQRLRPQIL
jgi:hypothetical protein